MAGLCSGTWVRFKDWYLQSDNTDSVRISKAGVVVKIKQNGHDRFPAHSARLVLAEAAFMPNLAPG